MAKVRIITDSASDIDDVKEDFLTVLPINIKIGDEEYLDCVNLSKKEFYEKLVEQEELPKTSLVGPAVYGECFEKAHEAGEKAVVITLSSKLSGTYQSACLAAQDFEGEIFVVDSENACVGEKILVDLAIRLVNEGKDAEEIYNILNEQKKKIRLVALLDTLEYLKKGGRISAAAATIGGLLKIKPVIAIEQGEIKVLGKARGSKQGNNLLVQEIEKSGGIDFSMPYTLGYTGLSDALLQKYIEDSKELWEGQTEELPISVVGATIGTHIGPGGIAVSYFGK